MTRKCHVRFGGGPSEKYPLRQLAGGLPNDPVLLEGRLQFRSWENDAGEKRNKVDVVAETVQFLSRGQGQDSENGGSSERSGGGQKAAAGAGASQGTESSAQDFNEEDFDDIPF